MKCLITISQAAALVFLIAMVGSCAHAPSAEINTPSAHADGEFYDNVIGFYGHHLNHLEGVRRGGCPMHPSCSQYSRQAVRQYGFLKGWMMTMDRLMRCGRDALKWTPQVYVDGTAKFYDPVGGGQWMATDATPLSQQVDDMIQGRAAGPPPPKTSPNHDIPAPHPAYKIEQPAP